MSDRFTIPALFIACPYCHAAPDKPCTTASGTTATNTHALRFRPVLESWRLGYTEGAADQQDTIERYVNSAIEAAHRDRVDTITVPVAHIRKALDTGRSLLS